MESLIKKALTAAGYDCEPTMANLCLIRYNQTVQRYRRLSCFVDGLK